MTTPNWKAWLTGWLRAQPEVAALVGARVFTRLPQTKTYPLILVTRIGGGPKIENHLHDPLFQIDCYATSEGDAIRAANAAMDALHARVRGRTAAGSQSVVVTGHDIGAVHEGFDEALARTRFSVRIWAHA